LNTSEAGNAECALKGAQQPSPYVPVEAALKQLVPRRHLRITGILDLESVGARAVRMELAHDALEGVRARDGEEIRQRPAWMCRCLQAEPQIPLVDSLQRWA
jgi:hypothetical protein